MPNRMTVRASEPNARSPITGFSASVLTSRTGAKFKLNPIAASSVPTARAAARTSSRSPNDASSRIGGSISAGGGASGLSVDPAPSSALLGGAGKILGVGRDATRILAFDEDAQLGLGPAPAHEQPAARAELLFDFRRCRRKQAHLRERSPLGQGD